MILRFQSFPLLIGLFFFNMNLIEKALSIAVNAHAGQTDLDGEAYILHPMHVGLMGNTDEERATGFLHDVMEDCGYSAEQLLDEGIPSGVVNALRLLTHEKGTSYEEYLQRIIDSKNPIALHVKYNDLLHNYARGGRFPHLQEKHGNALRMIEPVVKAMDEIKAYNHSYAKQKGREVAIFAAGCFWGVQHYMQKQKGVIRSFAGYTGGDEKHPTYDDVRLHHTHHLEAVLVEFDPKQTSFETLCKLFFEIHDPSQTDGQGPDKGEQYLSAVFCTSEEQRLTTLRLMKYLLEHGHEVNTMVREASDFWIAEGYHQDYYGKTGGSPYCHVRQRKF